MSNMINKEQDFVKWECYGCGYKWKGKSPYLRYYRPTCKSCGSRNVHVYNWLIDKNKWEELRKEIIERDNFRCKRCGVAVELDNAAIHHKSYDDYYNRRYLITLCQLCHHYKHRFFLEQLFAWWINKDLPSSVLTTKITKRRRIIKASIEILVFILIILVVFHFWS